MIKINSTIYKWLIIVAGTLLVTIIGLYYYKFSPTIFHFLFPSCSFKDATGYDCVGCGGQRAVHELLHFNLISAIDYNLLFVLSVPLLLYYMYYSMRRFVYGQPSPNNFWFNHRFGILFIGVVLVFMILRNIAIPGLEWLNSDISFNH